MMENIDKGNWKPWWKNDVTNWKLFEVIEKWKWEELRLLLKWYFSMINHLGEFDYLVDNVDYYDEALSKLLDFSKTSFMEGKVWRVSDNGNKEYCWAHLRNLLSPFKNQIALIEDFSEWEIGEDLFKSFMNRAEWTFEENKKLFLEFCKFLEDVK